MSRATQKAITFAETPPKGISIIPVAHKMLKAIDKHCEGIDCVAAGQGAWGNYDKFDPMERGDPAFLCFAETIRAPGKEPVTLEYWEPVICVSTGKDRTFESLRCPGRKWKMKNRGFDLWRIPYRWRPAVLALCETYYTSRQAAEAAMEHSVDTPRHT